MSTFNRVSLTVIAAAWLAGLAGVLYLIWEERALSIDTSNLALNFEVITDGRAEQILASLIVLVLALPALGLIVAEFMPRREPYDLSTGDYDRMQEQIAELQRRLDTEQRTTPPVEAPVQRVEAARPEHYETAEPRPRRRWGFLTRSRR